MVPGTTAVHYNWFPRVCRYNSGCGLAAVGAWSEAEQMLRGAEQAARAYLQAVLRIHRIHMFLDLLDPDPDPSIIKQI
jgi:hypothetical protein